eukprot:COSAG06_NODE_79098_length_108_cov_43.555556_1_plen_21_part_10
MLWYADGLSMHHLEAMTMKLE